MAILTCVIPSIQKLKLAKIPSWTSAQSMDALTTSVWLKVAFSMVVCERVKELSNKWWCQRSKKRKMYTCVLYLFKERPQYNQHLLPWWLWIKAKAKSQTLEFFHFLITFEHLNFYHYQRNILGIRVSNIKIKNGNHNGGHTIHFLNT